jgi:hypothetical protein
MQIPRTNIQAPEKHQAPNFGDRKLRHYLDIEVLSFSGAWMLEFGALAMFGT